MREPGEKFVSASERTRLLEERIFSESRPKVRKVASDHDDDSDFECYDRFKGKPVHVDVDKEMAENNKSTLALLPNRSEEDEFNNNGETQDRDRNTNLRRPIRIFKPPQRLGTVPYF